MPKDKQKRRNALMRMLSRMTGEKVDLDKGMTDKKMNELSGFTTKRGGK